MANSKDVAAYFGKEPADVHRAIDKLLRNGPAKLQGLMFQEVRAFDPAANRVTRSFDMNRDGFTLLVMGFTGEAGP